MTTKRNDLAIGVFDERRQAEQAVADLWHASFPHDHIDMVTREGIVQGTQNLTVQTNAGRGAAAGAAAGAGMGAVAGALAFTLIPGLGAVLGGGLLTGLLGGAAAGAAGGTYVGPFVALELDEEASHYYARVLDEGRTMVLVRSAGRTEQAQSILRHCGARERQPAAV